MGETDPRYMDDPAAVYKIEDYEALYRICDDPWEQDASVFRLPIKRFVAFRVSEHDSPRVIDLGCGVGASSELMRVEGRAEVLGLDIAPTAIRGRQPPHARCCPGPVIGTRPVGRNREPVATSFVSGHPSHEVVVGCERLERRKA